MVRVILAVNQGQATEVVNRQELDLPTGVSIGVQNPGVLVVVDAEGGPVGAFPLHAVIGAYLPDGAPLIKSALTV